MWTCVCSSCRCQLVCLLEGVDALLGQASQLGKLWLGIKNDCCKIKVSSCCFRIDGSMKHPMGMSEIPTVESTAAATACFPSRPQVTRKLCLFKVHVASRISEGRLKTQESGGHVSPTFVPLLFLMGIGTGDLPSVL